MPGDIRRRVQQTTAACRRLTALVSLVAVCISLLMGSHLVVQLFRVVDEQPSEVFTSTSVDAAVLSDHLGMDVDHRLLPSRGSKHKLFGGERSGKTDALLVRIKKNGAQPSLPQQTLDKNPAVPPLLMLQGHNTAVVSATDMSSSENNSSSSSSLTSTEARASVPRSGNRLNRTDDSSALESTDNDTDVDRNSPFTFSPRTALRVAATILVGSGNRVEKGESEDSIFDGACTLRHTMLTFRPKQTAVLDFFILVESNVSLAPKSAWILEQCGYQIRISTTGIEKHRLEKVPVLLREAIAARAVGTLELLKLECLNMVEYDVVISLDADIMMVAPYPDLVELPYIPEAPYRLSTEFNGGLNVFFPKNDGPVHVERIINVLFTVPWTREMGFNGTGYGQTANTRISGGPMLQGLLPYYLHTLGIHPALGRLIVPPCRHNFYWVPKKKKRQVCLQLRLRDIASVHFKGAGFPKPWECAQLRARRSDCPVASWQSRSLYRQFGTVYRKAITAAEHENRCSYFHNRFLAEHTAMLQRVLNISKGLARTLRNGCLEVRSSVAGDHGGDGNSTTTKNATVSKHGQFFGIEYHLRLRWKQATTSS